MQEKIIGANKYRIDSENNLFRKYIPSNKFQHELDMSRGAYKLASETDLFDTPIIKNFDSDKNEIDFELLIEITTLREYFIKTSKFGTSSKQLSELKQLFYRIGRSLFLIHSGEKYFDGVFKAIFPIGFFNDDFKEDLVYIHGDFTMSNILNGKNNRLFIVDWNISPVYDFSANFGPRYWDLSFFISSLFYFSFSTIFSFGTKKKLAKAFLTGYLEKSNLDTKEFLQELQEFLSSYNYYKLYHSIYKKENSITRKLLLGYTKVKLNKFINSISDLFN